MLDWVEYKTGQKRKILILKRVYSLKGMTVMEGRKCQMAEARKHLITGEVTFYWRTHRMYVLSNLCSSASSVPLRAPDGEPAHSHFAYSVVSVQHSILGKRERGNKFEGLVRKNQVRPELRLLDRTGDRVKEEASVKVLH